VPERPVQLQGSRLARLALRLIGWELVFSGLPAGQGVLLGYPHTSNWDFVVSLLAKWGLGLNVHFWGKDSLFRIPVFGAWLRWLGGVPVDRSSANGVVGSMARRMAQARVDGEMFWLALSPEGTRKYQDSWRSGFYQLALQAEVPVGLMFFDYGRRRIGVDHFLRLSGDAAADLAAIATAYDGVRGKRPAQAAPIRLKQGKD
jgi:1-acyl-sn-glycerol-3-phosphate acyltransferase